ncbi:hypothetical protein ABKN59_003587 [Abortiporus biennis]
MSHSHGPGQPSHTHGPPPPQQQQGGMQQLAARPPDPIMQAMIEATYVPIEVNFGPPDNSSVLCGPHSKEECAECDVDYTNLNRLSRTLLMNPSLRCPPPPQVVSQKLNQAVHNVKEEGNALFKAGRHDQAIQRYTMATNIAVQRPPWEASQMMLNELSTVLSNRSAAYLEAGDFINALVDAETVIQIRRPWSKGHFRKAKALMKLGKFQEARDAIQLGLSFEFGNAEMTQMLADIDEAWQLHEQELAAQNKKASKKDEVPPLISATA